MLEFANKCPLAPPNKNACYGSKNEHATREFAAVLAVA